MDKIQNSLLCALMGRGKRVTCWAQFFSSKLLRKGAVSQRSPPIPK